MAQGFQIIWPQNSADLLKFIEHNPGICGVIFDWDEYSLDLCSDINQPNEYLPALCLHQHPLDDGCQRAGYADGALVFEYALGSGGSPFVCVIHRRIS
ncbi:Orn/Lys/Arg decarboxylase N-terminal domain-containing protein [Shigella flexneri]